MNNRRDFLKMFTMASIAVAAPIPKILYAPERLTIPLITGDGDMRFGVNGVERMRIYANGNVGICCINPSYELKIK
jgi:hypothetical protein